MIGVTGATGQLGRWVLTFLLQRCPTHEIVAAVRSPEKAAEWAAQGVIVREADYDRPETLEQAFKGLDKVLLISSSAVGRRIEQHRHVLEAAKNAGVSLIVYTSLLHADTSPLQPIAEEHQQTEAMIKGSGLDYVILRNGWYTENYEMRVRSAVVTGELVGACGKGRISSAARRDYAEAAAIVLTTEGHEGKTYELAGDEGWTMEELAQVLSRHLGKEIPYRNLPPDEYAAFLAQSGLPEPVAKMLASWETAIANDCLFEDSGQLRTLIGRPTTPLAVTVAEWLNK